jgi:RHS repeat-associated protein
MDLYINYCGSQFKKYTPVNGKGQVAMLFAFVLGLLFSANIFAEEEPLPNRVEQVTNNYRELFNLDHEIAPHTSGMFGERIGLSTGSISFRQTDVSIPGNNALPVEVSRVFIGADSLDSNTRDFGSWGLDIPHIRTNVMALEGSSSFRGSWGTGNACSGGLGDGGDWSPYVDNNLVPERGQSVWNGDNIHIPNRGSAKIIENTNGDKTTSQQWKISCYNTTSGHEGFIVTTTDGTQYTFGQLKQLKGKTFSVLKTSTNRRISSPQFRTYHTFMLVTQVKDKFGNTVDYKYDSESRLYEISASDTRKITLTYRSDNLVSTVRANNRTWSYTYIGNGSMYSFGEITVLTRVARPDGKSWQFNHPNTRDWRLALTGTHELSIPPEEKSTDMRMCESTTVNNKGEYITITHPDGLTASYEYDEGPVNRLNVPWEMVSARYTAEWSSPWWSEYKPCRLVYRLRKKIITHLDGGQVTWNYAYPQPLGYFEASSGNEPTRSLYHESLNFDALPYGLGVNDLRSTVVTAPDGSKVAHHFSGKWGWTENQELFTDYFDTDGTSLIRRISLEKNQGPAYGNSNVKDDFTSASVERLIRQVDEYHYSDASDRFMTEYSDFNNYDVARKTKQSGGLKTRYTTQRFVHDTANWALNLTTEVTVGDSETNQTSLKKVDYNTYPSTGNVLLPERIYGAGEWQKEYVSYHDYGLTHEVRFNLPMTVGQTGNTYQKLAQYKRGLVTQLKLANRYGAGEFTVNRVIDDNGWVTQTQDLNGHKTHYSYDSMGRLKSINPETSLILDTAISWKTIAGTPVRTTSRCTLNSNNTCVTAARFTLETTYNGYLRPTLVKSYDDTTSVYQNYHYNYAGNTLFSSVLSTNSTETRGESLSYDGLQRQTRVVSVSGGEQRFDYLSNNRIRNISEITASRSATTTTGYYAYGSAQYDMVARIDSPESTTTVIDTNVFGNILSVTQSGFHKGATISQTETREYNSSQYLCMVKRSDVGNTYYETNTLGGVTWQAQGVSGNSCRNHNASSEKKSINSFDNLGDVRSVTYGDISPTLTYTLDNNGDVTRLVSGSVVKNYGYNAARLLESEDLSFDNKYYDIEYGYDNLGGLSSLTYPDGIKVDYAPNGFGQATKASKPEINYVHSVNYHPNGAIENFYYGNDIFHETMLNNSQLPSSISDGVGGAKLVDLKYTYDYQNNIRSIMDDLNPRFNLTSLDYDLQQRLISTTGGAGAGNASIEYDALGNITYKATTGGDKNTSLSYGYNLSNNRLTSVTGTGSTGYDFALSDSYDNRGNITHNGKRGFQYNQANQMVASEGNTYLYDGHNRRVKTDDSNGISYSLYSQSGQLLYRETPSGGVNYVYLGKRLVAKDGVVAFTNTQSHYKPYGDSIEQPADDVGYTGHIFDTDLGLNYMQARYYDPVIGRFYSNDPVGFTGEVDTFNRYSYVANNPYKYTDPDGEQKGLASKLSSIAGSVCKKGCSSGAQYYAGPKAQAKYMSNKNKSSAKRRAARKAQRNKNNPKVSVSQPGSNVQGSKHGESNLRGQTKTGMDGKTGVGIQDGSKDSSNGPNHPPAVDVGNLKPGAQPGKNGQPRIQNQDKVKEDIK